MNPSVRKCGSMRFRQAIMRRAAADHVARMTATCADKGYDAVEFDNLDSWTRLGGATPFDRADTVAYASLLVTESHDLGLAVAQKNAAELIHSGDARSIGFDFAVVEECGTYDECDVFADYYHDAVIAIEYSRSSLASACAAIGDRSAVVQRDLYLRTPGQSGYVFARCDG